MSYTETFSSSVSGSETVSVSYPASEHGGSKSVTVHWQEPINIAIHVDTRPFDRSIDHCGGRIDLLAGAVVATEAAQIAAIAANANKVSNTVLNGFFTVIRSEISQQILGYRTRCEALMLKLNDMQSACLGKKTQMQKDYDRISSRYTKVFEDLDRELANRVRAIDSATFKVQLAASTQAALATSSSDSAIPTVYNAEENQARSALGLGSFRRDALQLLRSAEKYLATDRQVSESLRSILGRNDIGAIRDVHLPVLYSEMDALSGAKTDDLLASDAGPLQAIGEPEVRDQIRKSFREPRQRWKKMDDETRSRLEQFLHREIRTMTAQGGGYETRVAAMLVQLWNGSRPEVPQ